MNEWITLSDVKIQEWVRNAVNADNDARFSDHVGHSSSVLDIFTFFQQQIDFINCLKWPDEFESRIFIARILEQVLQGMNLYCSLIRQKLVHSLQNLNNAHSSYKKPLDVKFTKFSKKFKFRKSKLDLNQNIQAEPLVDPKVFNLYMIKNFIMKISVLHIFC